MSTNLGGELVTGRTYRRPPVTADYLPDTGCSLHNSCFTCPFPQCRYDERLTTQAANAIRRRTEELAKEGLAARQIARRLNRAEGTIFRILADLR
jgi:hypothetical protein